MLLICGLLTVAVFVLAFVAAWLSAEVEKARKDKKDVEIDLRSARHDIEVCQKKCAELATRLDEARRAAKGGEP